MWIFPERVVEGIRASVSPRGTHALLLQLYLIQLSSPKMAPVKQGVQTTLGPQFVCEMVVWLGRDE